jgi:hypothetical protein
LADIGLLLPQSYTIFRSQTPFSFRSVPVNYFSPMNSVGAQKGLHIHF